MKSENEDAEFDVKSESDVEFEKSESDDDLLDDDR